MPDLVQLPAENAARFAKTAGLPFSDGRTVAAAEIWRYLTEEAPRRFPRAFHKGAQYIGQISDDFELFSGIKYSYLSLTLRDRIEQSRRRGVPTVLVQGGQSFEPYYAAGAIALRPGYVIGWARDKEEGLDVRASDWRGNAILEKGRRHAGIEACHQIAAHAAVQEGIVDVDLVAPYLNLRCSDMAYLVESQRRWKRAIPLQAIDYPVDTPRTSAWAVDLLADELRRLTAKVGELTGRPIGDADLSAEIVRFNRIRRLAREIEAVWQSAEIPPTSSTDLRTLTNLGNEPTGDVLATTALLEQALAEVKDRVARHVPGRGIQPGAVRLFVCGSCVTANPRLVDGAGGVIVGHDDQWSAVQVDVDEAGTPYQSLARAILSQPYEQPTRERALWTAAEVRRTRAQGLLFIYQWGCNYQSAVARMVADIVKEEAGVPTLVISSSELSRSETTEQSQNRVEAFLELLRFAKA